MLALIGFNGIQKFDELDNDLQKQIQYVYNLIHEEAEYKSIRAFLKKAATTSEAEKFESPKAKAEKSRLIRDKGNKAYSHKEFEVALGHFGESALVGPIDEAGRGREVAVALANRSAVHFEMEEWSRCLADIEASLRFGYPDELTFKLHDRRGRCYMHCSRPCEAVMAFQECLHRIDGGHCNLEAKKQEVFITEAKKRLNEAEVASKKKKGTKSKETQPPIVIEEEKWKKCPFTIWDRNPRFPPLSDALGITYNESGGRHIVAKRNIIAGEPLVIEEPVSAHLSACFMDTNCHHCLRRNGFSVLPSPVDPKARFCSLTCLDEAMSTYHPLESKVDINDLFYSRDMETGQMSGCISLAYRAISQKSLEFFLNNKDTLFGVHDIKFGIDPPSGFTYTGDQHYRGLYNLVNHQTEMNSDDKQAFCVRTVILLKCLQEAGYFDSKPKGNNLDEIILSPEELYIGELLFHFQTGIQYNLHAVYQVSETELQPGKRIPLTDIGAGCYPTTIFFNHSCAPNTVRINQGKRVVYVAKRNIEEGDQVTDCYGIHHLYMGLQERQAALLKGYAFKCDCIACTKNHGMLGQLPASVAPKIGVKLGTTMTKYKELFEEGKTDKALKCCQDYLGKLEELRLPFPHRNYELAAVALCSCLWRVATRHNS